jgi:predicted permease
MTRPVLSPLTRWLIQHTMPIHWRESVEGDLVEDHARRRRDGRSTGTLWQVGTALSIAARLRAERDLSVVHASLGVRLARFGQSAATAGRLAIRFLVADPGTAAVAVLTLALGIAMNATIFSVANWLIFRPLAGVDAPSRLVAVHLSASGAPQSGALSLDDVQAIGRRAAALEGVTGLVGVPMQVSVTIPNGDGRRVAIEFVMSNYFDVLHAHVEGRGFTPDEERRIGAPPVAVISDTLRERLFPGGPSTGRIARLNGVSVTIVGVAPRGFLGTKRLGPVDIWMPIAQQRLALPPSPVRAALTNRRAPMLFSVVGRLRPGESVERLQSQLALVEQDLLAAAPKSQRFTTRHLHAVTSLELYVAARNSLAERFQLLLTASGLMLALVCANVAGLMFARAASRRGELATRLALGASTGDILMLFLMESGLLAVLAGAMALVVTWAAGLVLEGVTLAPFLSPLERIPMDWRVAAWCGGLSIVAALGTGVLPALWAVRADHALASLRMTTRTTSGERRYVRRALMTLQVAVALVLVTGAALLVRSMAATLAIDPGFAAASVRTFSVDPHASSNAAAHALQQRLVERVAQVPGVRRASLAFLPPFFSGTEAQLRFHTDHDPKDVRVMLNAVRPGFFDVIGQPIVAGRDFTEADVESPESVKVSPVILTENVARRAFGSVDAVGRTIIVKASIDGRTTDVRRPVVGIVRDARQRLLTDDNSADLAFQPYRTDYGTPFVTVVAAVSPADLDVWPAIRDAVAEVDPALVMFDAQTAREGIRAEFGTRLLVMRLAAIFGVVGILVAAAGLAAVLARRLVERQRELGIRVALGATPARVTAIVTREAAIVLALGLLLGTLANVWLTRFLQSSLTGVSRFDALSFWGAAALVIGALAAASIPTCRRAAGVDPVTILRE